MINKDLCIKRKITYYDASYLSSGKKQRSHADY